MVTFVGPPVSSGGTTYTAGNGIALSGDEFSSKIDGTTLTNTGGGSSDSLAVLKVPGTLSVAGSLSLSASGYDGSGDVTITGSGTTYTAGNGITLSGSEFSSKTDGTTLTNTGGGSSDALAVLKVPGKLYVAGSLSISASGYDGSGDVTITGGTIPGSSDDVQYDSFGVGTAASGTTGEIRALGDITAFFSSDKRLKDNITPITEPLSKLSQLGGYTFDWIPKEGIHSHEGRDVGVIAQEVEEVLPEVTTTRDNGYKAVKYEKIVPLLIECIKAQQSQIDELKVCLSKLK